MRKLSLIAAASLLIPVAAQAKPLNELLLDKGVLGASDVKKDAGPGRLTYDDGVKLEFPSAGAKWNLNVRMQQVYSYYDYEGLPDRHSFDARNVRLDLGGSIMNDEFSWKLTNDFTKDTDSYSSGSKLQDAYIDWHACPECNIRAGQWATPFGRQWMDDNQNLQFIDRSIATDFFSMGRQEGFGYYGSIGDSYFHQLALFNGNSTGEGLNTGGVDNRLLVVYNGALDLIGHYDRSYEGDPGNTDGSLGLGFSAFYGDANATATSGQTIVSDTYDQYGVALDLGYRGEGASFQIEGFYKGWSFDNATFNGDDSADFFGLYVQGGYFFVPQEWEIAARFGWIDLDDDVSQFISSNTGVANYTDAYELNFVLSYYLNGHNLKIMTGPSWVIGDNEAADDVTDFRYQLGLFGYF